MVGGAGACHGVNVNIDIAMATSDVFVCTICNNFASKSYGPVLRHIGVVHRFGPSCSIRCGIDGCPAT